jgi:ribonucleoside-diphosphate reductase alpha chain
VGDLSAIAQLNHWKVYAKYWCEHKPSVSIYIKEHEWLEVGTWVYQNWEIVNGISFFPMEDHMYPQAPYEAITEEQYKTMLASMPADLDFSTLEDEDNTISSQELACVGGACDL